MKKQLFSMVIALVFLCFIILPVAAAAGDEKASVFPMDKDAPEINPDSVIPAPEFPTVLVPLGLIGLVGLFVVAARRS